MKASLVTLYTLSKEPEQNSAILKIKYQSLSGILELVKENSFFFGSFYSSDNIDETEKRIVCSLCILTL